MRSCLSPIIKKSLFLESTACFFLLLLHQVKEHEPSCTLHVYSFLLQLLFPPVCYYNPPALFLRWRGFGRILLPGVNFFLGSFGFPQLYFLCGPFKAAQDGRKKQQVWWLSIREKVVFSTAGASHGTKNSDILLTVRTADNSKPNTCNYVWC